jgi:hypothetical protein
VTMRPARSPIAPPHARSHRSQLLRATLAALLGVATALLVACSSSGKGLIPTGDAGPLQSDFEAVARAAEHGDGSCSATESALLKTDQDFAALPASVDSGLRDTLRQGIENLRSRSLALCAQPLPQATTSTPKTTTSDTTTTTTPTVTQTTSTPTTATTPPPENSGPGGGTPAPGAETPGLGESEGGAESGGAAGGAGGGGQEAAK